MNKIINPDKIKIGYVVATNRFAIAENKEPELFSLERKTEKITLT